MKPFRLLLALLGPVLMATGCASFRLMQTDAFVDDQGNAIVVEYGECSKPYTYRIQSPANGNTLECQDTKMVRVRLPSDKVIVCRVCQNESPKGTMYATKDGKWKYLTIGLASRIYLWYPDEREYLLVFEGSNSPSALDDKGRLNK
ncbi:MAG: hypothetical protein ACI4R9_05325 [Kiritimatiellia bacterium]